MNADGERILDEIAADSLRWQTANVAPMEITLSARDFEAVLEVLSLPSAPVGTKMKLFGVTVRSAWPE